MHAFSRNLAIFMLNLVWLFWRVKKQILHSSPYNFNLIITVDVYFFNSNQLKDVSVHFLAYSRDTFIKSMILVCFLCWRIVTNCFVCLKICLTLIHRPSTYMYVLHSCTYNIVAYNKVIRDWNQVVCVCTSS